MTYYMKVGPERPPGPRLLARFHTRVLKPEMLITTSAWISAGGRANDGREIHLGDGAA
jgi:hypothetical protein